ncbi:C-type lectin domain family 17, member A [Scophthalmus maximus]|uniref:C-type lectin domain family 17, member A n=1 Tax=Scophthalmus maximus TaxID=52904 RepID=UPI001FA8ED58|nr:C-type lectin domain family 17, member A [Scophthalmus maximus]XP_035483676.2 C-type lectin domain family 17, member A [Scophthalmus maximus]
MRPVVVTVVLLVILMFMTDSAVAGEKEKKNCQNYFPLVPCGSGWYRMDGSRCMKRAPTAETFDDAQMFCKNKSGDLVSFRGRDDLIQMLCLLVMENNDKVPHWLGARKQGGEFQWADGRGPLIFGGQHNLLNDQAEDCAAINIGGPWKGTSCSATRNFVCQKTM